MTSLKNKLMKVLQEFYGYFLAIGVTPTE